MLRHFHPSSLQHDIDYLLDTGEYLQLRYLEELSVSDSLNNVQTQAQILQMQQEWSSQTPDMDTETDTDTTATTTSTTSTTATTAATLTKSGVHSNVQKKNPSASLGKASQSNHLKNGQTSVDSKTSSNRHGASHGMYAGSVVDEHELDHSFSSTLDALLDLPITTHSDQCQVHDGIDALRWEFAG